MIAIPSPRSNRKARIEIIPLIDIVFFLLATFVMVSLSMVKNRAIPVNLPAANSSVAQDRSEFSSITVDAQGEIFFNKEAVTPAQLEGKLKALLAANPEPKVYLSGDTKAEFGRAIGVLDQVRKFGITKIAIETTLKSATP